MACRHVSAGHHRGDDRDGRPFGRAVLGALLVLVGVIVGIGGAVFGGATLGVFGAALYRDVAEDRALGPFAAPDLDTAARTR